MSFEQVVRPQYPFRGTQEGIHPSQTMNGYPQPPLSQKEKDVGELFKKGAIALAITAVITYAVYRLIFG